LINILFVPGLLCSAEVFAPQVAALWPYGPVTVASTLVGTTISAISASRFMRRAPERVIKLAPLDTSALPDTPEQITQRRDLVSQARTGDFEAFLAQALTAILHPAHQNDPVLRATNVRMALAVGLDGLARQEEAAITRVDSRPSLAAIKVPTLVLVGDRDPLTPPDRAEEIASAIPGARLVVVPECGHGSTLEQSEAVNRALFEWITG
jgi:pimeloyl-ACP methyl ester carboxylesterase